MVVEVVVLVVVLAVVVVVVAVVVLAVDDAKYVKIALCSRSDLKQICVALFVHK